MFPNGILSNLIDPFIWSLLTTCLCTMIGDWTIWKLPHVADLPSQNPGRQEPRDFSY